MAIRRRASSSAATATAAAAAATAYTDSGVVDVNGAVEENRSESGAFRFFGVFRSSKAHVGDFLFPVVTEFHVELAKLFKLLVESVLELRIRNLLIQVAHEKRFEVGRPFRFLLVVRTPRRTSVGSIVVAAIRTRIVEGRRTAAVAAAASVVVAIWKVVVARPVAVWPAEENEASIC